MNTTAMIWARLTGAALPLASFDGAPAIFSDRAPDAFIFGPDTPPCAVIAAPLDDDDDDTLTEARRQVRQDIRLYAYDDGSSADLDQLGRDVRALFHCREADLALSGGVVTVSTVAGPVESPTTDAAVIGRRLTLNLTLQET